MGNGRAEPMIEEGCEPVLVKFHRPLVIIEKHRIKTADHRRGAKRQ
jgi:hypothetical protein